MARITFDPEQSVIVLDVTIESKTAKRRLKMVLDTGATYSMIPLKIAEALGYKPHISREKITLVTASGVEEVPLIKVDNIRVLGKEITDSLVICHDLPQKGYVDGLLGLKSLKELGIRIDFKENFIEV